MSVERGLLIKDMESTAKWVALFFTIAVVVGVLTMIEALARWHVALTYALPVPVFVILLISFRLWHRGEDRSSGPLLWIGLVYVLGGISFDIAATILHSPDLSQEQNPIARVLLDSGHTLTFVYVYSFLMQGMAALTWCILWAGFLRHKRLYLESAYQSGSRSYWSFFKAATGGGDLSWRQWLIPIRHDELPSIFPILLFGTPCLLFGGATYRYVLGLQWYELFPFVNEIVLVGAVIGLAILIEMIWLRHVYSCMKGMEMEKG